MSQLKVQPKVLGVFWARCLASLLTRELGRDCWQQLNPRESSCDMLWHSWVPKLGWRIFGGSTGQVWPSGLVDLPIKLMEAVPSPIIRNLKAGKLGPCGADTTPAPMLEAQTKLILWLSRSQLSSPKALYPLPKVSSTATSKLIQDPTSKTSSFQDITRCFAPFFLTFSPGNWPNPQPGPLGCCRRLLSSRSPVRSSWSLRSTASTGQKVTRI